MGKGVGKVRFLRGRGGKRAFGGRGRESEAFEGQVRKGDFLGEEAEKGRLIGIKWLRGKDIFLRSHLSV